MAANDVITAYERLSHVLYKHGKNNREQYDADAQKEEYLRLAEEVHKQPKTAKDFLLDNQEKLLIQIADLIKVSVESQPSSRVYSIKLGYITESNKCCDEIEMKFCSKYLERIALSLMECACTIQVSMTGADFCPMQEGHIGHIMDLSIVANF